LSDDKYWCIIKINIVRQKMVMRMKEARCYGADDFQRLLLSVFQKRRPKNEEETWLLQQEYLRLVNEAPHMWENFLRQHQHIYERFGYLDVIVHDDLTVERKKLKRGRPKEDNAKPYRITVRLEEELYQILQDYCQTKNISESEAIRELIRTLKFKY
jgi:hypothetical protein